MSSARPFLGPGVILPVLSANPASPEDGLTYINATTDTIRSYDADSTTWREYATGGGSLTAQGSVWVPDSLGATGAGVPVANNLYFARVYIPEGSDALTGVEFRPSNATGSVKAYLADSTGTQIRTSAGTALTGSGFGTKQAVAFASAYSPAAGYYYVGLAFNNASSNYTSIGVYPRGGTKTTAYTTPANITVPTDVGLAGPMMWTY